MLRVWGRRSSFNVQKVMWLVAELGIEHEHIELGGSFAGLDTDRFRAMNPHGKVPVIDDDGVIVWESHAILRYLAATYGRRTFWPESAQGRAAQDQWMDWSNTSVQPDFLNGVFWGFYRTPESERNLAAVDRAINACRCHFLLLDQHLATRRYIGGEAFGLADIPLGTTLYRYFGLDIDRPRVKHVENLYARLRERSAYQAHVMVPFHYLFARLEY
jgi:glutathione S-transferase